MKNNRQFLRLPVSMDMTVEEITSPGGEKVEGTFTLRLQDLSGGGLCYISKVEIAIGTRLKLQFAVGTHVVHCSAEVVHVIKKEPAHYDIGCRFINMTAGEQQQVVRYITRASAKESGGSSFYSRKPSTFVENVPLDCAACICEECGNKIICRPCVGDKCGKKFCWRFEKERRFTRWR